MTELYILAASQSRPAHTICPTGDLRKKLLDAPPYAAMVALNAISKRLNNGNDIRAVWEDNFAREMEAKLLENPDTFWDYLSDASKRIVAFYVEQATSPLNKQSVEEILSDATHLVEVMTCL